MCLSLNRFIYQSQHIGKKMELLVPWCQMKLVFEISRKLIYLFIILLLIKNQNIRITERSISLLLCKIDKERIMSFSSQWFIQGYSKVSHKRRGPFINFQEKCAPLLALFEPLLLLIFRLPQQSPLFVMNGYQLI